MRPGEGKKPSMYDGSCEVAVSKQLGYLTVSCPMDEALEGR